MTDSPNHPQPLEPPKDLISSERVRFLTSWKLWLPMLFAGLLLIAAAILWPAYRRMRAIDLIEARQGSYRLGEARLPWLADKLGRLGLGYYAVEELQVHQPISVEQFGTLTALNDAAHVTVVADQVTPEWVETAKAFHQLKELRISGNISLEVVEQLIEDLPTLKILRVGNVIEGDTLSATGIDGGAANLQQLYIESFRPAVTVEGFRSLEYLWLDDMKDASLTVRQLPALQEVYLVDVNEGTTLVHDEPLQRLSYGLPEAERLIIPADVQNMYIQNIARCTITGGENLESLRIHESADMTVADLPALKSVEFTTSFGGTLTLRDLPALEHFMLMTREGHISPTVEFEGVDNLRAIDANWWKLDDEQLAAICRLPRLEYLVIPRATLTEGAVPMLHGIETLRFLRFPRRMYNSGDVDFAHLRSGFPQPGIRIHGPPRPGELDDRWSPPYDR